VDENINKNHQKGINIVILTIIGYSTKFTGKYSLKSTLQMNAIERPEKS
jgi:hypothetical protein